MKWLYFQVFLTFQLIFEAITVDPTLLSIDEKLTDVLEKEINGDDAAKNKPRENINDNKLVRTIRLAPPISSKLYEDTLNVNLPSNSSVTTTDLIETTGGPTDTTGGPTGTTGGPTETIGGPTETTGGPTETTGGLMETTGGLMETTGGSMETTGGPTETTGGPTGTTGGPTETTTGPAETTTDPTETTTDPTETTTDPTETTTDPTETTTDPTETTTDPTETTTDPTETTTGPTETTTGPTETTTGPTETTTSSTVIPGGPSDTNYPHKVEAENGVSCILCKMSVHLTVEYKKKDNKVGIGVLTVPETADTDGECGDDRSMMRLSWSKSRTTRDDTNKQINNVIFTFVNGSQTFYVESIHLAINLDSGNFPDAAESTLSRTIKALHLFETSLGKGRHICASKSNVKGDNITLSFSNVDVIAFNKEKDIKKEGEICSQDLMTNPSSSTENGGEASVNVAAIVGGVVAAVVVIAIIGYFIWRNKKKSYERSEVP